MKSKSGFSVAVLLLAGMAAGCSISASSASISDSITGSSRSVSDSISSSSPGESSKTEQAYRDDVRDYTAHAARAGRGVEDFQTGLAQVAERHGVTHWEGDDVTWVGIGQGLARAGVGTDVVDAWSRGLAPDATEGKPVGSLIRRGYDGDRS